MWLGLISIIQKRYHIPKKICTSSCNYIVVSHFLGTGKQAERLVLKLRNPYCLCGCYDSYVCNSKDHETKRKRLYIITYALIDGLFGIIPALFMIFG